MSLVSDRAACVRSRMIFFPRDCYKLFSSHRSDSNNIVVLPYHLYVGPVADT